MKKLISVFILSAMVLTLLAGCGKTTNQLPKGMSGKEAASLMLANQRLNSQLLQNSENIFESGSAALMQLSEMSIASLSTYSSDNGIRVLSSTRSSAKHTALDGSYVEINGNKYRWGGFTEYSNSYDYFLNLTTNISNSAKIGAQLIDDVKKNVRVIDMWVDVGGTHHYLHVEEDSETLFSRDNDSIKCCIRTKTEDGSNRYEVAEIVDDYTIRMIYIPGKLCEYSYVYGNFNHNFLAVNNKGFWEVVDVGVTDSGYNVSCMVIKDNICYDAFYNPSENTRAITSIKVISADRKTDILEFSPGNESARITLSLQGYKGYQYFMAEATPDQIGKLNTDPNRPVVYYDDRGTTVYITNAFNELQLIMNDGDILKSSDTFVGGKVMVESLGVIYSGREPDETTGGDYGGGYVPTMSIVISAGTYNEQMALLRDFLNEVGLVCSRDINYVQAGILQAMVELEQFTRYHEWNESPIYTEDDLAEGWKNNLAKHNAYKSLYEKIKDAQIIDFSDRRVSELHMSFAKITNQSASSISNDQFNITVENLSLTVEDTLLFSENESYAISFALIESGKSDSSDLNHINAVVNGSSIYTGTKNFTVSGSATFTLPLLANGEYILVAYICTVDGIRSSAYTEIPFTSVTPVTETRDNLNATLTQNQNNGITMSVTKLSDIEVTLPSLDSGKAYTRATMEQTLEKEIYRYAFVAQGASLEILSSDGSWKVVEGANAVISPSDDTSAEDEPLPSGTYRLRYEIRNGEHLEQGSVFTVYTAVAVE